MFLYYYSTCFCRMLHKGLMIVHLINRHLISWKFSYSRVTCKQNNVSVGLILHLFARWCYYCYRFTIPLQFTILLSVGQLAQLGQGGWASYCESARFKKMIFYMKHMVLNTSLVPYLYTRIS